MPQSDSTAMLELIHRNIQTSGFHIYIIKAGAVPRFAYTIGLSESLGTELVLAGAIYYMLNDVNTILHAIREDLTVSREFDRVITVGALGSFTLREAHRSWTQRLLLGAVDYYKSPDVRAYQIVPDQQHWTIDTPNMAMEWSATAEPIWRWLQDKWLFAVAPESTVTTNLAALRGSRITEVARWGEDEWEMFAGPGPDVSYEESRVVSLSCILGVDPSLAPALNLEVGKGLRRDEDGGEWNPWGSKSMQDPD